MQATKDIIQLLNTNELRIALGISLTLLFSIVTAGLGLLVKQAISAKKDLSSTKQTIDKVNENIEDLNQKMDTALTNHFPHIEMYTCKAAENSEKSNQLLERFLEGQNEANIRAAELNAFIRAKMD
jgi:hypothetical protein